MRIRLPLLVLLFALMAATRGQTEPDIPSRHDNLAAVAAWDATNQQKANSDPHRWQTLPGILIDLSERTIHFKAEAIKLDAKSIIEFFLIGTRSGHAYEAMAYALAEPEHIAAAIEQLGIPRGRPVDYPKLRFWPEGERVFLSFNDRPVESLLLDARSGKPLAQEGLVYTGSLDIQQPDATGLAAQVVSPFSIAANYNEPRSLLDVPRQAPQSAVYSSLLLSPDFPFHEGQLIEVTIKPEYPITKRRVQKFSVLAELPATINASSHTPFIFSIAPLDPTAPAQLIPHRSQVTPTELLEMLREWINEGYDPFIQLKFADQLPVAQARQATQLLRRLETDQGIRLLPPPPNAIYHQAFTPNEAVRDREARFAHPWEIRYQADNQWTLIQIDESWQQGELKPEYTTTPIAVTNGFAEMVPFMLETRPSVRGIFIYVPAKMEYRVLRDTLAPLLPTHPQIHVYLNRLGQTPDQTLNAAP